MTATPTVVEELAALRDRGYVADISVTPDGQLRWGTFGHVVQPGDAAIERTARFEGASNPDDQAIVFGIRCLECGARGALVAAYGPTASAAEAAVVTGLRSPQPR